MPNAVINNSYSVMERQESDKRTSNDFFVLKREEFGKDNEYLVMEQGSGKHNNFSVMKHQDSVTNNGFSVLEHLDSGINNTVSVMESQMVYFESYEDLVWRQNAKPSDCERSKVYEELNFYDDVDNRIYKNVEEGSVESLRSVKLSIKVLYLLVAMVIGTVALYICLKEFSDQVSSLGSSHPGTSGKGYVTSIDKEYNASLDTVKTTAITNVSTLRSSHPGTSGKGYVTSIHKEYNASLDTVKTTAITNVVKTQLKTCPNGWIVYTDFCYLLYNQKANWTKAKSICEEDFEAYLAEPDTEEFDKQLVTSIVPSRRKYWLGGSDIEAEGKWKWMTGESRPFTYTNWISSDPNDGGPSGAEDCLLSNWLGNGKWADGDCNWKEYFVCQMPLRIHGH